MIIKLTVEQSALVTPHLQPGRVWLGRIMREPFDGSNASTSGRLQIELGSVPESCLPKLRAAIAKATKL